VASERSGIITFAVDGLVVNDQDVREVNILGAINNTEALCEVELCLFATVRPIKISILAGRRASERASGIRGIGGLAVGGEGEDQRCGCNQHRPHDHSECR